MDFNKTGPKLGLGPIYTVRLRHMGQAYNENNNYNDNKQLLDEVEHDIMNYQNRGLCYLPKPTASADNIDLGFDNSWYHAQPHPIIIVLLYIFHIIHPKKQKRSVQPFCFWGEHSKGLSNQADVELDMINAADIAFIMSSSQAIVNWLNALDQSDFS